jgi:hypothetical protein
MVLFICAELVAAFLSVHCFVILVVGDMQKKNSLVSFLNSVPLFTKNYSRLRIQYSIVLKVILVSCVIGIVSWVFTPSALALTQIKLSELSYHKCPSEIGKGSVTSGTTMAANCFIVTGKAQNGTNKTVYDADIFGRIYDANNNSAMENRNRLGSIKEIPPGVSDFELRISVAANQPEPLKLKKFKAAGFSAQVRK